MKVRKIIRKYFQAILTNDQHKEKKLYFKLLKKSLKNKHTEVVR